MDVLTERTANILLHDDDDDDEDAFEREDDDEIAMSKSKSRVGKHRLTQSKASRRRRRSSARFIKLPSNSSTTMGDDDDDDDDDDDYNDDTDHNRRLASSSYNQPEDLGQVYQNAIRMNAENKINASNSWNLNLIDHMDRFLSGNGSGVSNSSSSSSSSYGSNHHNLQDTLGNTISGVNFTKASCTLDASVKIYSYRVDDVHLTSYKVLANLNRTDTNYNTNNKKNKASDGGSNDDGGGALDGGAHMDDAREERRAARSNAETLENNLGNINIHKLDAAFDIDPLFHKMSKTFDEGGAKGLLLANLNVSGKGCNIVFDSSLDNDRECDNDDTAETEDNPVMPLIDISSLMAQLNASLSTSGQTTTMHEMPLVPQLVGLRAEFRMLKEEGFVEDDGTLSKKRYAAPKEDEMEADKSIHIEAMERSRASQGDLGRSLMMADHDDDDSSFSSADDGGARPFDSDDFGGANDDYDDDDDRGDVNMGGSIDRFAPVSLIHDGDHRFSSESFQTTFEASQPPSQTTVLLDAIAAGEISGSQSNYEYFNKDSMDAIAMATQGGNQWAGAAHWKKMQPKRPNPLNKKASIDESASKTNKKQRKGPSNKAKGGVLVVDATSTPTFDMKEILRKPPKGKKGSSVHLLQMTKAAVSKASKNENLLPLDIGIQVRDFTALFLRPKTNLQDLVSVAATAAPVRQVGFGGVQAWGQDDANSYGDNDDDGAGFNFGGDDNEDYNDNPNDFIVPELEGIRKVEKVKVGYATVATKVDVKRLKTDLWKELERSFRVRGPTPAWEKDPNESGDEDDVMDKSAQDAEDMERLESSAAAATVEELEPDSLSFQDTVREMQTRQCQADITLPFYFICILHLANEKGLALESTGLEDFIIHSS